MININDQIKYVNNDTLYSEFRRVVAYSGGNSQGTFIINKDSKHVIISSDLNYYSACIVK